MYSNAKKVFITATHACPAIDLLTRHLHSEELASQALWAGGVWQGKTRLFDPKTPVNQNDTLRVYISPTQTQSYMLSAHQIVFENDNLIVVTKPPGVTAGPDRSHFKNNLTYAMTQYFRAQGISYTPSPITRLDFMVSGLSLFAKHKAAEKYLFRLTQSRQIGKLYLARTAPMDAPPKCLRVQNKLAFINKAEESATGKSAHSVFFHRGSHSDYDEYAVILLTGRRHQIRHHASHYLAPLIGDTLYKSTRKTPNHQIGLVAIGLNIPYRNEKLKIRLSSPETYFPK